MTPIHPIQQYVLIRSTEKVSMQQEGVPSEGFSKNQRAIEPVMGSFLETSFLVLRPGQAVFYRQAPAENDSPSPSLEELVPETSWTTRVAEIQKDREAFLLQVRWLREYGGPYKIIQDPTSGTSSPLSVLESQLDMVLETGPELTKRKDKKIWIKPYARYHVYEGDQVRVILWNWFEDKPFFDQSFPAEGANLDENAQFDQWIKDKITAYHRRFKFRGAIRRLPKLTPSEQAYYEEQINYRKIRPETWNIKNNQSHRDSWKKLLQNCEDVSLTIKPIYSPIDKDTSVFLDVEKRHLRRRPFKALSVNGRLEKLTLYLGEEEAELRDKIIAQYEPQEGDSTDSPPSFKDKYGNTITIPITAAYRANNRVMIEVTPSLGLDANESSTEATFSLDLSKLGLGDHPNLLMVHVPQLVKIEDLDSPYNFYSSLKVEDTKKAEAFYELAAQQLKEAERLLGVKPGSLVRNVILVPSEHANAYAHLNQGDTIFISEEMISKLIEDKIDFVYFHEVSHLFDYAHGFSDSRMFQNLWKLLDDLFDQVYLKVFMQIDKKTRESFTFEHYQYLRNWVAQQIFFGAFNEKSFYRTWDGGHSEDNARELFASLLNGILSPYWQEVVDDMSEETLFLYQASLNSTRNTLLKEHPAIQEAPIFKKLEDRIGTLEKMRSSEIGKDEQLAQPMGTEELVE